MARPVKRTTTAINPVFAIPEGAEEIVYDEQEIIFDDQSEFGLGDELDDGVDENALGVPRILSVYHQKLRRSPDGGVVVDVTINTTDVTGVANYEIRVTKR